MIGENKIERTQAGVIKFTNRKPVSIDPELKKFLDEVVVPMLIRGALKEVNPKTLETEMERSANSGQRENVAGELSL